MYDTIWNSREEIFNTGGKEKHNYTVFYYKKKYDAISSTPAASVSYTNKKCSPMTYLRFQRRLKENSPEGWKAGSDNCQFICSSPGYRAACVSRKYGKATRRKRRWWREGAKSVTCGRLSRSREEICVQSSKLAEMTAEGQVAKCVDAVRKERQ